MPGFVVPAIPSARVVAAVGDAGALRRAIEDYQPDVAIIDVQMPPTHTDEGLRAAKTIHQDFPQVGVLVFSQYIEARAAAELFANAPTEVGYLLKDRVAGVSDFIDAITRIAGVVACSTPGWCASCWPSAGGLTEWRP